MSPPRHVFPRGNVGTSDSEFRSLISSCRLPTSVIKSLKLSLTKRTPKRYQCLKHHYNENVVKISDEKRIIFTKNGHEITPHTTPHDFNNEQYVQEKRNGIENGQHK